MDVWPAKDPAERLDFGLTWTRRLQGDTISSYNPSVEEGSVVIDDFSNSDTETAVWLTGGELGETCIIANQVTTAGGRVIEHSRKLKIKAK